MLSCFTFLPLLLLVWSAMGPIRAGLADPIAMVMDSYAYVFAKILLFARMVACVYTTMYCLLTCMVGAGLGLIPAGILLASMPTSSSRWWVQYPRRLAILYVAAVCLPLVCLVHGWDCAMGMVDDSFRDGGRVNSLSSAVRQLRAKCEYIHFLFTCSSAFHSLLYLALGAAFCPSGPVLSCITCFVYFSVALPPTILHHHVPTPTLLPFTDPSPPTDKQQEVAFAKLQRQGNSIASQRQGYLQRLADPWRFGSYDPQYPDPPSGCNVSLFSPLPPYSPFLSFSPAAHTRIATCTGPRRGMEGAEPALQALEHDRPEDHMVGRSSPRPECRLVLQREAPRKLPGKPGGRRGGPLKGFSPGQSRGPSGTGAHGSRIAGEQEGMGVEGSER